MWFVRLLVWRCEGEELEPTTVRRWETSVLERGKIIIDFLVIITGAGREGETERERGRETSYSRVFLWSAV